MISLIINSTQKYFANYCCGNLGKLSVKIPTHIFLSPHYGSPHPFL